MDDGAESGILAERLETVFYDRKWGCRLAGSDSRLQPVEGRIGLAEASIYDGDLKRAVTKVGVHDN